MGSCSGFKICCQCILGEFDRELQGHYISSGHETAARGKSGVLFLICWHALQWYIGTVWTQTAELVTSDPVDIPLLLSLKILLGFFLCVCFFRYHASLHLKRMNAQEQGEYTFYARSDLANASITFQVQMYRKWQTRKSNQLTQSWCRSLRLKQNSCFFQSW